MIDCSEATLVFSFSFSVPAIVELALAVPDIYFQFVILCGQG